MMSTSSARSICMAACLLLFCSAVKAQLSPLEIAARNKATTLKSYAALMQQLGLLP